MSIHWCGGVATRDAVERESPTTFSPVNKADGITLTKHNLRASYCGPGRTDHDSAAVLADQPVPVAGCVALFFETHIINAGQEGFIGIGLTTGDTNLSRLPGWESGTYGYHGDDGCIFVGHGTGTAYGPTYTTGDVVGCFWNLVENTVAFTRNREYLGVALRDVTGMLYPTVGLRSVGGVVEVNFGGKPFLFDVESFLARQNIVNDG